MRDLPLDEKALAELGEREGELSRALIDAHDQLLRRDREIAELQELAKRREAEVERLEAANRQLGEEMRAQAEAFANSRTMRLQRRITGLPGVRWVLRRRRAA